MKLRLMLIAVVALCAASGARAEEKLTILLDWFVNPDHGPIYVALERGYFKEQGLTVELIAPADPNDPPRLVAAGKGDLAVSYQPALHIQVGEGVPLKRIGTLVATPLNSLVVLRDGPIKTIADLKGKKIGFSLGGIEEAVLKQMLAKHGVSMKDVTMVNVNFSLSPSLMSGQVDAVIGAYRNFELNQLALEGKPGRAFYPEDEGVPAYDELIVVAHKDKTADPRFRKFLDAVERGTLSLINRPDEGWELFIKGRKDLDNELNKRAWRDTLPRFAQRPAALDTARYARFAAFLEKQGVIKKALPVSDYAVEVK
ncbi:MAG: ABC transporter substrate-binding protein [Alphaproteobacteria bacterium]